MDQLTGDSPATFTSQGFRRGFVAAQPLAPGTFLYGVVFGVLASEKGLAWAEALLMSVLVYSGSAQLAALQGWSASPLVAALVTTVVLINARYVLYGASIQPWLRVATRPQAFATLFFLGDGNWALSMREYHAGYRDAGFLFGSGVATALPWFVGTAAGHLVGSTIPHPTALGLDFMLVAFAAAIGVSVFRGRSDLWPALAAVLVAAVLAWWLPGWTIVGAAIAAGLVGGARVER
ncbi:AzlC family ABC transporter permease [Ramlibacter sp. PS3R-8]|uniref:AzlC family ABC transporter permease n=1 Tax=Ramlibacter sp. PS3R-8 TaxID=3133437 RepID=UPI00309495DA